MTPHLFLDDVACTLEELQTRLQFHYLPQNIFEDRKDLRKRGMSEWKKGAVSDEAQELGSRFRTQIEGAHLPKTAIRWLDTALGHGLFADEDLEQGAYVGEYTGLVRKNDRRYFEPLNDYCYEYPVPDSIGRSFVIDATQGNLTRFINHSYSPNLRPVHAFFDGFYHLIFLALQPIARGTQLSYDYGRNYWYLRDPPIPLS